MKAIRTKWMPAQNYVRATDGDGNTAKVSAFGDATDKHRAAAMALIRKMDWAPVVIASGWLRDGEQVHVMLPAMREPDRLELARVTGGALYPVEAL